MAHNTVT